jgi:hypothetical protein
MYVSGTNCQLCLRPLTVDVLEFTGFPPRKRISEAGVLDAQLDANFGHAEHVGRDDLGVFRLGERAVALTSM